MSTVQLDVRDLQRTSGDRVVIANLSFTIRSGEILFVVGPAGTGKTLLLRALACLDPVKPGTLRLNGKTPEEVGIPTWRTQVAYVGSERLGLNGTPSETYFKIQGFHSQRRRQRGDLPALVHDLGLEQAVLNQPWVELRESQARRVAIAIALALQPEILLVDEPTAACDLEAAFRVEHVLKSCGSALVWVTADHAQPERVGGRVLSLPLGAETAVTDSGSPGVPDPLPAGDAGRPSGPRSVATRSLGFHSAQEMLSPRTACSEADGFSTAEAELTEILSEATTTQGAALRRSGM